MATVAAYGQQWSIPADSCLGLVECRKGATRQLNVRNHVIYGGTEREGRYGQVARLVLVWRSHDPLPKHRTGERVPIP